MRQIVPDVYLVEGVLGSNVYLLVSGDSLTLVDTGIAGMAGRAAAQLQAGGYSLSNLQRIVLTHWHGDHSGSAPELARASGAQLLAHRDEAPYLATAEAIPTSVPVKRALNWLADSILLRRPPCMVDRQLEDGDTIDALGGLRAIHAPGHSPGSLCLYHPERQILFCGDALFAAHPITRKHELGLYMRWLTFDNTEARESARRLYTLPVQTLCCGHGEPIVEGAHDKMTALFRREGFAD